MHSQFDKFKPFSVYGIGSIGRQLIYGLRESGYELSCIIDHRSQPGQTIAEIPCIKPEQCRGFAVQQVLLGVFNREVSPQHLAQTLIHHGVKVIIPYPQIAAYFNDLVKPVFWFDDQLSLDSFPQKIAATRALFSDIASLETFDQLHAFRKTPCLETHVEGVGLSSQYFPSHIPNWLERESITMVDCGAFNGDTLASALQHQIPLTRAYCFEPDQENFSQLQTWSSLHPSIRCQLYHFATWSSAKTLYFSMQGKESSAISATSTTAIKAIAIDEILADVCFNFIKLDVEGAEMETLKGAIQCLLAQRPYIAVSLYHRPTDLWDIPLFLAEHLHSYRYHLVQHGHHGLETILYAVPEVKPVDKPDNH